MKRTVTIFCLFFVLSGTGLKAQSNYFIGHEENCVQVLEWSENITSETEAHGFMLQMSYDNRYWFTIDTIDATTQKGDVAIYQYRHLPKMKSYACYYRIFILSPSNFDLFADKLSVMRNNGNMDNTLLCSTENTHHPEENIQVASTHHHLTLADLQGMVGNMTSFYNDYDHDRLTYPTDIPLSGIYVVSYISEQGAGYSETIEVSR